MEHLYQCELHEALVHFDARDGRALPNAPYSFQNLTDPSTWLLFGTADNLVGPARFDVSALFPAASLPGVIVLEGLGHGDFVWSDLAHALVNGRVVDALGLGGS